MTQEWIVSGILVIVAVLIVRYLYRLFFCPKDRCDNCPGCALKEYKQRKKGVASRKG